MVYCTNKGCVDQLRNPEIVKTNYSLHHVRRRRKRFSVGQRLIKMREEVWYWFFRFSPWTGVRVNIVLLASDTIRIKSLSHGYF